MYVTFFFFFALALALGTELPKVAGAPTAPAHKLPVVSFWRGPALLQCPVTCFMQPD